jgi:hypothetical protein
VWIAEKMIENSALIEHISCRDKFSGTVASTNAHTKPFRAVSMSALLAKV